MVSHFIIEVILSPVELLQVRPQKKYEIIWKNFPSFKIIFLFFLEFVGDFRVGIPNDFHVLSCRFVTHEMLGRRNYIKDDTLFLKIRADPKKGVCV